MINESKTKEMFGYISDKLTKGSHKKICATCDYCGKDYFPLFKNFNYGLNKFNKIGLLKDCCKPCGPFKTKEGRTMMGTETLIQKQSLENRRKTYLKKYGTTSPQMLPEITAKTKETWAKKTPEEKALINQKHIDTCLKNYGVTHVFKDPAIKAKTKQTCLERYGVQNPSMVPEFKEKREQTMLKDYGVRNFSHSPLSQPRIKAANMAIYGVECSWQAPSVKEKIIQTKIKRYGSGFPTKIFGKAQKEVQDYINSFGFKFKSDHKILEGKEIDIYDDNLKLGIEYCGLYWHSEGSLTPKDENYHYNKFKMAASKGVYLITLFEDEWIHKQKQVKAFLKNILNKNDYNINSEDCEVKTLDKQEACQFLDQYSIEGGNLLGMHYAGLYYNNDLVGVMSFANWHGERIGVVLDRLCFKSNYSIKGGTCKLFQFLLNNNPEITKIISWSDNRWSNGMIYEKMRFKLEKELPPDYSYIDKNVRSDFRLSKQSQRKVRTNCPADKTEREWAMEHGFYRIWDCGKKRWIFTR